MPLSKPTTRVREDHISLGQGRLVSGTHAGLTTTLGSLGTVKGKQVTVSEGHPFRTARKRGDKGDLGGDFFTQRQYAVVKRKVIRLFRRNYTNPPTNTFYTQAEYRGPVYPVNPSTVGFPPASSSSNSELDMLGATAVARCKPTNSVADAATFLGELLKDGIPSIVGSTLFKDRSSAAHKAGSEYLNVEFGWLPIKRDVEKFAFAVQNAHKVLDQYERDAGRQVRRRYHFPQKSTPVETTTVATNVACWYTPGSSVLATLPGVKGDVIRTRETVRRQWFSGAFTYHLPSGYDSRSRMARYALEADKLLGISLTPEVLWNLAPWSWAIDWFANTGDVLSNISDWASDGLVMRYGYIMEHTTVRDTYTFRPSGPYQSGDLTIPPLTMVTETKIRRRANPFGFGINWSGLSPRQWAITAALGLSRR